jgi:VWFA-related protein
VIKHLKKSGPAVALAALLIPGLALAAGAQLSIQQVEINRAKWPKARGFVNVIGASGSPIPGLSHELFKVYEAGSAESSKILKVESLEAAQTGASIVVVVQASGAMMGIQEDLKKAVAAFVNGLGEKDQVAVVDYAEAAETVSPFSEEKGDVAGKAGKITFNGKSYLLFDGLAQAISLYASAAAPGKGGQAATLLPAAKAVIVISDGRDNGSATDVEKIISDANKRRIPIHAVGHSELDQDSLSQLEVIAHRTGGTYKAAPSVDDINKALTVIKDYINKMYVVEWRTSLDHDGKGHKVEIAMENEGGASLKSSVMVKTPDYTDWLRIAIIAGIILLVIVIAVVVYVMTRPKPAPTRFCPVCRRAQMPEWEICLFCLKAAKGRLTVQKGVAKGKTYPLVGKIVSLGSAPENNIRVMDGGVSGKHAGVAIDDNKFEIVDLGSKNGVLVNGKKTPRRFLRNGDVITLGMTEFKFESSVASADDEAED